LPFQKDIYGGIITKRPWFGPKRYYGWGWSPITWQGWLVTAVLGAVVIAAFRYFGITRMAIRAEICAGLVYFAIVLLTGTKPGDPGSKDVLH
jgi:hypothetical protein